MEKALTHHKSTDITKVKTELIQRDKLLNAFRYLNMRPFEDLLGEDITADGDKNKYDLLAQIERQFQKLKALGNIELNPVAGRCLSCKKDTCGYRFVGNKTGHSITYIITALEEGRFDIANCSFFQVPGEAVPEPF